MGKFFFKGKEFQVLEGVYEPREDSFLLAENVQIEKNCKCLKAEECKCLDLGCGSGIQTLNLLMQGGKVLAVDLNEAALKNTVENVERIGLGRELEVRKSDLFEGISEKEKFDCIVFNPPYLISEDKSVLELDGGEKGREVLDKFLLDFENYLKDKGVCFFLQSSLNGEKETGKILQEKGFEFEVVAREKVFFEELMVFKVWK